MNEFDIIRRFFTRPLRRAEGVSLGVGDDGAIVEVPAGHELVLAMDTLVEGVHFPTATAAADIGWKALAVNLSDLAAMGAEPRWATCSLTLPAADANWIAAFRDGFFELADHYCMDLIGGDLCRGPLVVTVQAHGLVPAGQALLRAGARPGDQIFVTGTLGDAGFALHEAARQAADREYFLQRLNRPQPRVALGQALRGMVSSAIDISDGLLADLGHVLEASRTGAEIHASRLPISAALGAALRPQETEELALSAGDDYELCVTVAEHDSDRLRSACRQAGVAVTAIGRITDRPGLVVHDAMQPPQPGYRHFNS